MKSRWVLVLAVAASASSGARGAPAAPEETPAVGGVVLRAQQIPPDDRFRWLPDWRAPAAPRWGFALGGGAAWGLAHIGVLEAAKEDGFAPDLLAGTSIGALIGSLVASGASLEDVERVFRDADWNLILTRGPWSGALGGADPLAPDAALYTAGRRRGGNPLLWRGLIPDQMITAELFRSLSRAGAVAGGDLDRLSIPFRAVSVDLVSGAVYAPREGSLATLVRASAGFPVFAPVLLGGRVLTDGGVLENVPAPTARAMGAEAVIAVRLSVDGQRLDPVPPLTSLGNVLGRTYDVAFASQREKALADADLVLNVAVGDASLSDFHDQLDRLIEAGRAAWSAQREAALAALESRARDKRTFVVRSVAAGAGATTADADEVAGRLGLAQGPATCSALRLELELVRLLRRGGYPDGRLEVREDDRLVISLDPPWTVRRLILERPSSLDREFRGFDLASLPPAPSPALVVEAIESRVNQARRRGLFLCGISSVTFDPESGALQARLEEGALAGVEIRSAVTGATIEPPRQLLVRSGGRGSAETVIDAVERLYQRGAASDVRSVDVTRQADGRHRVTLAVEEPPVREWSVNLGASDALRAVLWGRMAWPSFAGWRRWGLEIRGVLGRQGGTVAAEASPAGELQWKLFARTTISRAFVPRYTSGGDLIGSHGFWTGALSLGARTPPGRAGAVALVLVGRGADRNDFLGEPATDGFDLAADLLWSGDRRDAPAPLGRGVAWSVGAVLPLAGESRARLATADVALGLPLDVDRRWSVELLGQAAVAEPGARCPWTGGATREAGGRRRISRPAADCPGRSGAGPSRSAAISESSLAPPSTPGPPPPPGGSARSARTPSCPGRATATPSSSRAGPPASDR